MMKGSMLAVFLCVAASAAHAMSQERKHHLLDVLDAAMRCESYSDLLKNSLADERARLRQIITMAGMELGMAMYSGALTEEMPAYGRRCMTRIAFRPNPGIAMKDAIFNIGYELGIVKACFRDLFFYEMREAVPVGPIIGGDSPQAQDDRRRMQDYSRRYFVANNCSQLAFPD